MELWSIILTSLVSVIGGGGLVSLLVIRYTKRKAKTEANSYANKEQSERIDLGDKYVTQMLSMLEKLQIAQQRSIELGENNSTERRDETRKISARLNEIHNGLNDVKNEVTSIVEYLNGGYQSFKDTHPIAR